jgi:hypothetical protein
MHVCSHGGETNGYKATLEFADRLGGKHNLEFYEVLRETLPPSAGRSLVSLGRPLSWMSRFARRVEL